MNLKQFVLAVVCIFMPFFVVWETFKRAKLLHHLKTVWRDDVKFTKSVWKQLG